MANAFRYQDFVDEQQGGQVHGVFVDDTGSPGLRDTPGHLHPERKSWVAVVVPRSEIKVGSRIAREEKHVVMTDGLRLTGRCARRLGAHDRRRRVSANVQVRRALA